MWDWLKCCIAVGNSPPKLFRVLVKMAPLAIITTEIAASRYDPRRMLKYRGYSPAMSMPPETPFSIEFMAMILDVKPKATKNAAARMALLWYWLSSHICRIFGGFHRPSSFTSPYIFAAAAVPKIPKMGTTFPEIRNEKSCPLTWAPGRRAKREKSL